MAKSKKPRKPYRRPDFKAEAAALNPEKYSIDSGETLHLDPNPPKRKAPPKQVPVDKEPPAPAHPHVVHPAAPQAARGAGRYLVPVAAGAGVIGGGAYLAHRARRRKAEMSKGLIDPTTGDRIVFEKRYLEDDLDETPRGALVSKSKMSFVSESGDVAFRQRARDRVPPGVHRAARKAKAGARTAARAPKDFAGGFLDTVAEGQLARGTHATQSGKMGTARRTGAVVSGIGGGTALTFGAGHLDGKWGEQEKERARRTAAAQAKRRKTMAARKQTAAKRFDETALQHHGSRRMRKLPVSSVRVPGLPVQSARFSRGNPELIPGTRSHANKLTHVHNGKTANRTGKLFVVHRKSRSKSGSSVGKSAGYAQSGGSGRRLVNV